MINALLRILGYYDSNGLKYSLAHLKRMQPLIPFWPRNKQAQYADKITVDAVNKNEAWLCDQIRCTSSATWGQYGTKHNATSVGNMAYIATQHKNADIRKHAENCLINLQKIAAENTKGGDIYYM